MVITGWPVRAGIAVGLTYLLLAVPTLSADEQSRAGRGLQCQGRTVTVDLGAGEHPTGGSDVIRGTSGRDVITAGTGNDTVCALGGNDVTNAGPGADSVQGGTGGDTLNLGRGNDHGWGQDGPDVMRGGDGGDYLIGGPGQDHYEGGRGFDICGFDWMGGAGCEAFPAPPRPARCVSGRGFPSASATSPGRWWMRTPPAPPT